MKPFEHHYNPGQIHAAWFKRGSMVVVLKGSLRLTYRNASLDWLLDSAPMATIMLEEGECHVLPHEAWVEVVATGRHAALARIDARPPFHSMLAAPMRWLATIARRNGVLFRRS